MTEMTQRMHPAADHNDAWASRVLVSQLVIIISRKTHTMLQFCAFGREDWGAYVKAVPIGNSTCDIDFIYSPFKLLPTQNASLTYLLTQYAYLTYTV